MIEGLQPEIAAVLPHLHKLSDEEKQEVLDIVNKLEEIQKYKKARENFMDFVAIVWPSFIEDLTTGLWARHFKMSLWAMIKDLSSIWHPDTQNPSLLLIFYPLGS